MPRASAAPACCSPPAPRALVTAPWPATIRYRGPLLDYGNVMILELGSGYLLILAGLETVYGEVGDVVPAGAALGLMGGPEAVAQEFLVRIARWWWRRRLRDALFGIEAGRRSGRSDRMVRRHNGIGRDGMKKFVMAALGGTVAGALLTTQLAGPADRAGSREKLIGL